MLLEHAGKFFDKAKANVRVGAFDREYSGVQENPDAPLLEVAVGIFAAPGSIVGHPRDGLEWWTYLTDYVLGSFGTQVCHPPTIMVVFSYFQGQEKVSRIGFVAGTIPAEKVNGFERLLFRATRGNMYLRQGSVGDVKDPVTNETVSKHVFVIFFAGDRSKVKITKVRMNTEARNILHSWGCARETLPVGAAPSTGYQGREDLLSNKGLAGESFAAAISQWVQ